MPDVIAKMGSAQDGVVAHRAGETDGDAVIGWQRRHQLRDHLDEHAGRRRMGRAHAHLLGKHGASIVDHRSFESGAADIDAENSRRRGISGFRGSLRARLAPFRHLDLPYEA